MNYITKNFIVIALYYLFGRLGLLMSSDPSMATLFWPGAGLVVAAVYLCGYRLLPAAFLGPAILNLTVVYSQSPSFVLDATILRAILIGLPPAFQAFAGAYLVRRFLGPNCRLETLREVVVFSLCAGPISCLISPILSVSILYGYGLISAVSVPLSLATWYVGDMLGVLVFAPVCVMFFNETISSRRKVLVTLPLVSLFLLVVAAFFYALSYENAGRRNALITDSNLIAVTFQSEVYESVRQLASVRSFFKASNFVSSSEFDVFLNGVFSQNMAVREVYWAPHVVRENLKAFEEQVSRDLGKPYAVSDGGVISAGDRADYYPILYSYQREGGLPDLSLDFGVLQEAQNVMSNPDMEQDLWTFSGAGILFEKSENTFGLFLPLYGAESSDLAVHLPQGFIIGTFNLDATLKKIHAAWAEKGIDLQVLMAEKAADALSKLGAGEFLFESNNQGLLYQIPFAIGDARWVLSFSIERTFFEGRVNWGMWYMLAGSFLFTFLASGFLLVVTGHSAVTEAVVNEKTIQLKDQTNFLKVIMDNVPDMLFVKNQQHEIVAANSAFMKLYSQEDQEKLIGRTGLEIFNEEEQAVFKQQDDLAFSKGYTEVFESNTDHLGRIRTLFTRKIRFQDTSGRYLLLGIARDVSEILTAQEHLESILMATADGLLVVEEGGIITTYNKACEQIFGYAPEEVIGNSVSLLEPESQREEQDGNLLYYITLPGVSGERKREELLARHKSGTIFPIYLAASQVKVGAASFYCAVIRDISAEKKAQEDLRRSNQELEDFAYVASHDLKAPLRHLSLSANFLLRHYAETIDARGQELLEIIRKSSERMFEMIDSLLAYSSVGRKDVEMSSVHLGNVVKDVLEGMRSEIERIGAEVEYKSLPEIHGNRVLMIQLFQNLIENALKYRRKDTHPNIQITAKRAGWVWEIAIQDNGIGIDPEFKEKIFKIFQRLHSDSEYQGTGIGLAICQRIAEFHGGSIKLDESYSGGSRFVIALPVV